MSTGRISRLGWYAPRATAMSPVEGAWRARGQGLRAGWSPPQVTSKQLTADAPPPGGERRFVAVLPPGTASRVPGEARAAVLDSADQLLRGEWEVLGVARIDLVLPDWFRDPVTGCRSAPERYAFRIDHRSEEQ